MHVVAYAEWRHTSEVTAEMERHFAGSFRPDDKFVCVWTDSNDRTLLMTGFDIEAPDLEAAIRNGRNEILDAAEAISLSGELLNITCLTDEGYRT